MRMFSLLKKFFIILLLLVIAGCFCLTASAGDQRNFLKLFPNDDKTETKFWKNDFLYGEMERLHLKLFPVINLTDFQVWESKYYPQSILESKINQFLASLFMDYPQIDVEILDSNGMNRWLDSPRREGDMAAQVEIYRTLIKRRDNVLGNHDSNVIAMRVKIFDSINAEMFADRPVQGKDKRYTFSPSEGQLFFLDSFVSIPFPFSDGFDLLGLTKTKNKGQKMSFPTWEQFNSTSAWQAFKNATDAAHKQIIMHATTAFARNNGGFETVSAFDGSYTTIGKIISPTAKSTRKRREYIISLGEMDSVAVGDVLDVVRSDTYITVDPERQAVVIPKEIGKVKVQWVQAREAVVVVTHEKSRNDPVQLKDIVIKKNGRIRGPYGDSFR
ncbi:MAG: hypothetical protein FWE49_01960 [Synergistaceae bacterium]|nr:hypothetical protein [Synergistaceae bacterium]